MLDPSRRTFVKAGLAAGASGLAFLSLADRSSALAFGRGHGSPWLNRLESVFPGVKAFRDDVVGSFRGSEWAGATFHGDWLFANVQWPGVTFAIRGPWREGGL